MIEWQHHTVELADGVTTRLSVAASVALPDNAPLVLTAPAMGVAAKHYIGWCEQLAQQGMRVGVFDWRGHGHSSVRASRAINFNYVTLVENDFVILVEAMVNRFPQGPLILAGHSLGGQMAALTSSALHEQQHSIRPIGLLLIASCSVFYRSWPFPGRLGLLLFSQFTPVLATVMGYFPGRRVGFAGREARGVMRDWAFNTRSGTYRSYVNGKARHYDPLLREVTLPVMAIHFSDDIFAPLKAIQHLTNKLSSSTTQLETITAQDLQTEVADHYRWLSASNAVAERCAPWIKEIGV